MKITDNAGKTVEIKIYVINANGMPGKEDISNDLLDDVYGCPTNEDDAHIVPDVDYVVDAATEIAEENGYNIIIS